jgi:hypothetical protein
MRLRLSIPSVSILSAALVVCAGLEAAASDSLDRSNVIWDSPSADCHGSMPIGNGDLAANVWVEPNGDLVKNITDRSLIGAPPVVSPRYPAFWGPNFDGTPDQCHGSATLIALQRMLMLCDVDTIRLLPAWPNEWNADFKLHAPYNTTVEGRVVNGKVIDLKVTPESRRKDIVMMGRDPEKSNKRIQ